MVAELIAAVVVMYISNGTPPVVAKIMNSVGIKLHRVDFGANFIDGRPILGSHKSWEGLASGIAAGLLSGFIMSVLVPGVFSPLEPLVLSAGSMIGDLIGSFVKRRLSLRPGECLIVLDQLGFFVFGILFDILGFGVEKWTTNSLLLTMLLIITFIAHLTTNQAFSKLVNGRDDSCWAYLSKKLRLRRL